MTEAEILRSLVQRIEAVREEKKLLSGSERDLFAEAKGKNVDGKALRRVLQRRAMDDADRETFDNLVDQYEHALAGKAVAAEMLRGGATVRQAARAAGVSVGTAHAVRSKTRVSDQTPKSSAATTVASPLPGAVVPPPEAALGTPIPEDGDGIDAGWQSRDGHDSYVLALQVANGKVPHPAGPDEERRAAIQRTVALAAGAAPDEIPSFLDRRKHPRQTAEAGS